MSRQPAAGCMFEVIDESVKPYLFIIGLRVKEQTIKLAKIEGVQIDHYRWNCEVVGCLLRWHFTRLIIITSSLEREKSNHSHRVRSDLISFQSKLAHSTIVSDTPSQLSIYYLLSTLFLQNADGHRSRIVDVHKQCNAWNNAVREALWNSSFWLSFPHRNCSAGNSHNTEAQWQTFVSQFMYSIRKHSKT